MDKNINYNKHQRSRYARYTATLPNGKVVQAGNEEDLHKKINEISGRKNIDQVSQTMKQKFDPDTGERIN